MKLTLFGKSGCRNPSGDYYQNILEYIFGSLLVLPLWFFGKYNNPRKRLDFVSFIFITRTLSLSILISEYKWYLLGSKEQQEEKKKLARERKEQRKKLAFIARL